MADQEVVDRKVVGDEEAQVAGIGRGVEDKIRDVGFAGTQRLRQRRRDAVHLDERGLAVCRGRKFAAAVVHQNDTASAGRERAVAAMRRDGVRVEPGFQMDDYEAASGAGWM